MLNSMGVRTRTLQAACCMEQRASRMLFEADNEGTHSGMATFHFPVNLPPHSSVQGCFSPHLHTLDLGPRAWQERPCSWT